MEREHLRASRARTLRADAQAGLVLGVQSVPDGLATGLLAGLNPLTGLYGYMVGTIAGAAVASSAFMVVQGTGAMAMIIADVPALSAAPDEAAAVATLALATGAVMLIAGALKLGGLLRFVSHAVLVGFMNAVGVNIMLGQLSNLTGYAAPGDNRIIRTFNTLVSPELIHWQSVVIGLLTIGLILLFERTPVGSLGLVVAVIITSALAPLVGWVDVETLDDLGVELDGLPTLAVPSLELLPQMVVPALSLAFVGLVQGAGVSATYGSASGRRPDLSRDFIGQGAANVACAVASGMPVGGSASASALNLAAGARSRLAPAIAAVVMALVVLLFGPAVGYLTMPALAGLLILVGVRTIKPHDIRSVWRTGPIQKTVLAVTFVLTMVVPLQYAVLVGVGLSVLLYVVQQSNQIVVKRRITTADGEVVEVSPPASLPPHDVVVLQPYGSLFFASAPVFETALPRVTDQSVGTVVILRLRGQVDLGATFIDVLSRYAAQLHAVGSRLIFVSVDRRVLGQLTAGGVVDRLGAESVYGGDERVGAALSRALEDANAWVEGQRTSGTDPPS